MSLFPGGQIILSSSVCAPLDKMFYESLQYIWQVSSQNLEISNRVAKYSDLYAAQYLTRTKTNQPKIAEFDLSKWKAQFQNQCKTEN